MPPRVRDILIENRTTREWLLRLDGGDVVVGVDGPTPCEQAPAMLCFTSLEAKACFTLHNDCTRWARDRGGTRSVVSTVELLDDDGQLLLEPPCLALARPGDDGGAILTLLELFATPAWMASLPDHTPLWTMNLPGTHETCARFGWPISNCQRTTATIAFQLERGIRLLDLRFSYKRGHLRAYHGIQNQFLRAAACIDAVVAFLDTHPTECVVVSIKAEDATPDFEARVASLLDRRPDRWFREARWPSLGEVRGRAVLFSRYGRGPQIGLHPPIWPNNLQDTFEYELAGVVVVTQDWYDIGSMLLLPEKFALIERLLRASVPSDRPTVRLNFTSAGSLLAMPSWVAQGVGLNRWLGVRGINARLLPLLLSLERVQSAWLMLDFFDRPELSLVPMIIALNAPLLSSPNSSAVHRTVD